MTFKNGDFFEDSWEGATAIAIVRIDGDTLRLLHVTVLANGRGSTSLGVRGNRQWLQRLLQAARTQGFRKIVLEFERLTGANPGRKGTRTFEL